MIDYQGLEEDRKHVHDEILNLLKENDRVACVRYTGWGKTTLINKYCEELEGEKLVLTSTRILANNFKNCYSATYSLLHRRLENNDNKFFNKFSKIKYIFLDELHRVSYNLWGESLNKFLKRHKNVKIIGFTATPIRAADGINVVDYWFNNVQVEPLSIEDAIKNNYINDIVYVKAYFNVETIKENEKIIYETNLYDLPKAKIENIYNIDTIINKHYKYDKNGSKIIIFCPRLSELENISKYYYSIFNKLYKNKIINIYLLNTRESNNNELNNLFYKFSGNDNKDEIDLIFTVNKLNEGIHLSEVNTVIFMRPTKSEIIYLQQLGRSINNKESLVFDFSNNCERIRDGFGNINYKNKNHDIKDKEILKNLDNIKIFDYVEKINKIFECFTHKLTDEMKEYIKEIANSNTIKEVKNKVLEKYNIKISTRILCAYYKEYDINYKGKQLFTDEIKEYIKEINNENTTIKDIQNKILEKYGIKISESAIRSCCLRNNINFERRYKMCDKTLFTDEIKEYIKEIVNENTTIKDIQNKILEKYNIKISESQIHRYCKKYNVNLKHKLRGKILITDEIKEYIKEIANENITLKNIQNKILEKYGILIPKNSINACCLRYDINCNKQKILLTDEIKEYIKEIANENTTIKDIQNKILEKYNIKISERSICSHCKRYNINYKRKVLLTDEIKEYIKEIANENTTIKDIQNKILEKYGILIPKNSINACCWKNSINYKHETYKNFNYKQE